MSFPTNSHLFSILPALTAEILYVLEKIAKPSLSPEKP